MLTVMIWRLVRGRLAASVMEEVLAIFPSNLLFELDKELDPLEVPVTVVDTPSGIVLEE